MGIGPSGEHGPNAVWHVELEHKPESVSATTQHLPTVVKNVMDHSGNQVSASRENAPVTIFIIIMTYSFICFSFQKLVLGIVSLWILFGISKGPSMSNRMANFPNKLLPLNGLNCKSARLKRTRNSYLINQIGLFLWHCSHKHTSCWNLFRRSDLNQ